MKKYIFKRIIQLFFVLLGVTFLTFFITNQAPSDAAEMSFISKGITPSVEQLQETRQEMGLDRPLMERYITWLKDTLHGDLGNSFDLGSSVVSELGRALPATLQLTGWSFVFVVVISFPLGILTAIKQNKKIDFFIRIISFLGISIPNFWLALILIYFFSVQWNLFDVISDGSIKSMILPVITLTLPLACRYIRQIRTAILEELSKEYVIGARARGVSEKAIMYHHILPNAIVPVITLLSLSVGHLLGGAAIVETIFSWHGIGNMVVNAIRVRDYPIIQAYVIWMAVIYVVVNLISDIICHLLDPKLRKMVVGDE